MAKESFLLFHVGPIQDFIASARRCQDLWYGSWLLSHLARELARYVLAHNAKAMIFPGKEGLSGEAGISNKVVALVPSDDVESIAEGARQAMFDALEKLSDQVFKKPRESALKNYFDHDTAKAQVMALMECYWVAAPCNGYSEEAYTQSRQRAEELLAARKNTRTWGAVTWGLDVPKSSVSGDRESVLHEDLFDAIDKGQVSAEAARLAFGCKASERLCGVDMLKRLGREMDFSGWGKRPVFHSTSHMAAMPLVSHFDKAAVQQAFDKYFATLKFDPQTLRSLRLRGGQGLRGSKSDEHYDAYLLFENRLQDLFDEAGYADKAQKQRDLAKAKEALAELLGHIGHGEPNPYYVLLLADGDRMGKLIDAQDSLEKHQKLSRDLASFADGANAIVASHSGSLIYAGGDDVMALLPVHTALVCARDLAESFEGKLKTYAKGNDALGEPLLASLSVGLAVAHHLTPLSKVRAQAKRAEKKAKEKRGSLAIVVDKRSGGERVAAGPWKDDAAMLALDKRLEQWSNLLRDKELSHGFLHEVAEVAKLVRVGEERTDLREVLKLELHRVMLQKQPTGRTDDQLEKSTIKLLEQYTRDKTWPTLAAGLNGLSDELGIALEIARVQAQVHPIEEQGAES